MKAPSATLRLQFHRGFTLDDAAARVDYFADLGISHLYASPLLTARPGSLHGYDVIDPTRINPELGGEPALWRLTEALHKRDMGLILDIVSNHMAVGGSGNAWWLDVLEWGQLSPYARFFDIEWRSPDPMLEGLLLVPFLGADYGETLQQGELPLELEVADGKLLVRYFEHCFPLTPPSYGEVLRASEQPPLKALAQRFDALRTAPAPYLTAIELRGELAQQLEDQRTREGLQAALALYDSRSPEGFARLHNLLERQHYRLASWRTAADDINWRRFFDINELGGLRVERPEVFEQTHETIFRLIAEGLVDGLRIDHVDGLADPHGYCRKLRRRVERLAEARPPRLATLHVPIYVEKILGHGEHLPDDWAVDGTTGYEFMNQVSLLQHDPAGQPALAQLWEEVSGRSADFADEVRQARHLVLTGPLAGDFEAVAQALLLVARGDVMTRDITLGAIRRALLELIVHFPIYRTYIGGGGRTAHDEPYFRRALEGARQRLGEGDWPLLAHLERWLGGQPLCRIPPGPARKALRNACVRFQQLTSPAAAKAVEDTACYRSAVLLSRNDVGFDPQVFAASAEDFHAACLERAKHLPGSLLASATHDHKRGEDTRARLAVLSERADWFAAKVRQWRQQAAPLRRTLDDGPAPSPGDELILFQTLLGCWPPDLDSDDASALAAFAERIVQWQQKAVREAKLRSSWSAPNADYEAACRDYSQNLLSAAACADLRRDIAAAAHAIAPAGALNALVQSALRMTVPGLPDLYQGTEFWDFSLVDPDNRRPVDFDRRQRCLSESEPLPALLESWHDGRIKQRLIATVLGLRRFYPPLFLAGRHIPLACEGAEAGRLLAFAREHQGQWLLVLVPRLCSALLGDSRKPHIAPTRWGDTRVILPEGLTADRLSPLLEPAPAAVEQASLGVALALDSLPLAIFHTTAYLSGESRT